MVHTLDEITAFVIKYSPYTDRELIRDFIKRHLAYHTAMVLDDDEGNISAVCRWNIEEDGRLATILDLIIRPDRREKGLIKKLLRHGLGIWTSVERIRWQRVWKYNDDQSNKWREFSIKEILKDVNKSQ